MSLPQSVDLFVYLGATLFIAFLLKTIISDRLRFPAVTVYVAIGVLLGISVLQVYKPYARRLAFYRGVI